MIADLEVTRQDVWQTGDILVVGAGIAGLLLATRLARKGLRVIVLESGGREQGGEVDTFNRIVQRGDSYRGATHGRARCLGGTSTRWGGALIPFVAHDFSARSYLGLPGFPLSVECLQPYMAVVEKIFGVDSESYEENVVPKIRAAADVPVGDPDFIVRFAKWPSFKRRNVAVLLKQAIEGDPNICIWVNATVTSFDFDTQTGRLRSAAARSQAGYRIIVAAHQIVICAGAIESTRLSLLLDRQYDHKIFEKCTALGRFFYDHVSAPMATIRATRIASLNRLAALRFVGAAMRSLRFELSAAAQEREATGSAFGHISFRTERDTGFDALRRFLQTQQRSGRLELAQIVNAFRDLPYVAHMAMWKTLRHQLLWPRPATYELHVVVEQLPCASNYITLADEIDGFGLPLAAIDWRVGPQEHKTFDIFMRCFSSYWKRQSFDEIGTLDWAIHSAESQTDFAAGSDVYHPGGSTRMGSDPRTAVTDLNLRTHAVRNLWIASTSVFPSGGGANPTLTLMLFVLRLADHIESVFRTVSSSAAAETAPWSDGLNCGTNA